MKVMAGKKKPGQSHFPEPVPKPEPPAPAPLPATTTVRPQQQTPAGQPPQHLTQDPTEKIQLSKNIFFYKNGGIHRPIISCMLAALNAYLHIRFQAAILHKARSFKRTYSFCLFSNLASLMRKRTCM
jgi:hypothetical protein